jgi:RNA 3'-terminal phosphate cyclase (ATP)
MIRIDGSMGEGGGQMLRTALSLSLVTGKAFRIDNIRAGRKRPGLLRQHLTAVLAATEIGSGVVEDAVLGSKSLTFTPGEIRPGEYRFAVGTAGSATLVLQTILPALMTASGPSHLVIEGGTHNTQAPPFDFLEKAFLPLIGRMGPQIETRLERYGFYPAGGGRMTADIKPCISLAAIHLRERGECRQRRATAVVANLARHIAQREVETVANSLSWDRSWVEVIETKNSPGPGNVVVIEMASEFVAEIFTGFGRLGASAEQVASEAVDFAREYLASGAAVGEHLADQLLLPFALAGEGSFTTGKISLHARTNMDVIGLFLPICFSIAEEGSRVSVTVQKSA